MIIIPSPTINENMIGFLTRILVRVYAVLGRTKPEKTIWYYGIDSFGNVFQLDGSTTLTRE